MIRLHYWHGDNGQLARQIDELFPGKLVVLPPRVLQAAPDRRLNVSLIEFVESYPGNFMVLRSANYTTDDIPLVCITQHDSFGQR